MSFSVRNSAKSMLGMAVFTCGLIARCALADETLPHADHSASLSLAPARCVALHQGQTCYQRVQISWHSAAVGDYCVYHEKDAQPLHCWQRQSGATFDMEFAAASSRLVQLKNRDQRVVAEATFEVVWVYKANTRRKTHWRLF